VNLTDRELLKIALDGYHEKDTIDQYDTDIIVAGLEQFLAETDPTLGYIPQEEKDW
jgi:hypothetical protein